MSASDSWGTYKTPCPHCGGEVEWWHYAPDSRYNPSSSGIQCKGCLYGFTREEWDSIAHEELGKDKSAHG